MVNTQEDVFGLKDIGFEKLLQIEDLILQDLPKDVLAHRTGLPLKTVEYVLYGGPEQEEHDQAFATR